MEPTWKEYRTLAVAGVAALIFGNALISLYVVPQPLTWYKMTMPPLFYMGLLALLWRHLRSRP